LSPDAISIERRGLKFGDARQRALDIFPAGLCRQRRGGIMKMTSLEFLSR
jgi:hypothetical protein